eukprot:CAMPEP_0201975322 /NCGR_PEP_ID=MMETSP0904-20121228/53592_1 /ASSEMBLY_ACC=CAM_ASM_000553 /TAXON_ID=420261 /ORGANISM="Thalassiosira antarctica, Strain CCMP982" /LENGTH=56 /DNA_ID=CAMNT_0048526069 /DNA_START=111 /DNA_END=281 /DNA_ORIENTATION=-
MGSAQLGLRGLGGTRGSFDMGVFVAWDLGWWLGNWRIWCMFGSVGGSGVDSSVLAV